MKSKKLLAVLLTIALLVVPSFVFAATSDNPVASNIRGFFGINPDKLTDQQKADISTYAQKMTDLKKEFINKMVANGTMTKEQGDAAIKQIDEMLENGKDTGLMFGLGVGGKHSDTFVGKIDFSKLTEQQKASLTDIYNRMAAQGKNFITKLVDNGLITKEQGTEATKRVDDIAKKIQDNSFAKGNMMPLVGFEGLSIKKIDTANLTEQQKAVFKDFSQNMAKLQKEYVDTIVSFGLLTKEQGDNINKKIDTMQNAFGDKGFVNGKGMYGKHFGKDLMNKQ
ncbi:MAG: DUF2680 domain-containing protein [Caulobacteraceae bacterium]